LFERLSNSVLLRSLRLDYGLANLIQLTY